MARARRVIAAVVLSLSLLAGPAAAAPDLFGEVTTGAGSGTDHKPQSKLWFNDGTWWALFADASGQRMWKLENGALVKQTFADAIVDARTTSRCDVLWDGTYLHVLSFHTTLPRFSTYDYDAATQSYRRLPGFPVDLPVAGVECMVFDKDSTGRLWAVFENNHAINVIWTTTPDHRTWDMSGVVIETDVGSDDIATVVAFGGDKIGVLWSDQGADASWRFGFRVHRDADPPDVWQPLEVIDTGSAVDDHINLKADTDGRLWFAGKDLYNRIHVYRRAAAGGWSRLFADVNRGAATRPTLLLDDAQDLVHIFYTDWETSPNPIRHAMAPRSSGAFDLPEDYLIPTGSSSLNDPTGTKQHAIAGAGLFVVAAGPSRAAWGFNNLDTDAPTAVAVDPADETGGVPLQPLIQWRVADTGMGVRRSSIVLTIDGVPVTPTVAGNSHEYLVSYTPPTPYPGGRIVSMTLNAQDSAYPPHSVSETARFKTQMEPLAGQFKYDIQPPTGGTAPGYTPEAGDPYTLERGRGWDRTVSLQRANVHSDMRLDTYVRRRNNSSRITWSHDVANGVYRIGFAAGAPDDNGRQRIEVEDQVLVNNQTTAEGQFVTVSGYDIVVQDGRLDVRVGGAGSSSNYTQLCYFEFEYQGAAPPPPPPDAPAPRPVSGVTIAVTGNDLVLGWNAVTHDTTGALIAVTGYDIYRGTNPRFVPDRVGHSNRVATAIATSWRDTGAAGAGAPDYYYIVTAERAGGIESQRASNLALRRRIQVAAPGAEGPRRLWLALPYTTPYADASDLVTSMNGGTGGGPVTRVARVDRSTQARSEWSRTGSVWSGQDFALVPGDAVEITVAQALDWRLVGAEASVPAYGFTFHTAVGNVNWIALPQNADYADARTLVEALNGGSGAGAVTKLAWLDPATGRTDCFQWFAGDWRGNNFPLQLGWGIAVLVGADVPTWSPRRIQP
jgi:hypothetical protein